MIGSLIPLPYRLAAGALAIAGLIAAEQLYEHHIFAKGEAATQAKWNAEKLAVSEAEKSAVFAKVRANERQAEQQEIINQQIKDDHKNEIDSIRTAYAGRDRLRIPAAGGAGCGLAAGTEAQGTAGSDGAAAGTIALPAEIEKGLWELAEEADTVMAGCRAAQRFIAENGFAL